MKRFVVLGLTIVVCACGSSDKDARKPNVAVPGVLSPAAGLTASDFSVWGPMDDAAAEVAKGGEWSAQGSQDRTGIIFAGPKAGSDAAERLGPEAGLYMTPVASSFRLVRNGGQRQVGGAADGGSAPGPATTTGYSLASDGAAAMDATTTVISMLLMHPMLGHPASDVSAEQLRWIVARMTSGWPCLERAAAAYDANLVARVDVSTDATFTTAWATCLDEASAMPVFAPTPRDADQAQLERSSQPDAARVARRFGADEKDVKYSVARDGVAVSNLAVESIDDTSVVMTPKTRTGTALDYYYTVSAIDDDRTKSGLESPVFAAPNRLALHGVGPVIAAGFIPASSYWSYLDVVGNTIRKVSSLVASAVIETPNNHVRMSKQHMYEVRLFSGGFGFGTNGAAYDFATANLSSEHYAALHQNVTMGVVELIGVIPGAGEVLAEGDGGKVLQAVVQRTIVEVQALILAKGANVSGEDLYRLMYNVFKTAVDKSIEVASVEAQTGVAKKLVGYVVSGGKKVFKTIVGVPGKVAKGGSLGNRAFRLADPESVLEYHVVAVGYAMGDCAPIMNAMSIFNGPYPAACLERANLACAEQCTACGDSCVAAESKIKTVTLETCQICSATGMGSKECDSAITKMLLAGAFSPGTGQPEELAFETTGCVVNASDECLTWSMAQAICTLPEH